MLKPEMIKEISNLTGQTQATVADILGAYNDVIALELRVSGAAKLHGLGTLIARPSARTKARNPRTGERVAVAPRVRVVFKPTIALKASANEAVGR